MKVGAARSVSNAAQMPGSDQLPPPSFFPELEVSYNINIRLAIVWVLRGSLYVLVNLLSWDPQLISTDSPPAFCQEAKYSITDAKIHIQKEPQRLQRLIFQVEDS